MGQLRGEPICGRRRFRGLTQGECCQDTTEMRVERQSR